MLEKEECCKKEEWQVTVKQLHLFMPNRINDLLYIYGNRGTKTKLQCTLITLRGDRTRIVLYIFPKQKNKLVLMSIKWTTL